MGWNAKKDGRRKYGYARRGERATMSLALGPETRGRFSLLGACTLEGMSLEACELVETTDEAINGRRFLKWVREKLVPMIRPFPAVNSVVIADNCSFHHNKAFIALVEAAGGKVLFLSAYR
jgi:hypothetical protein